MRSDCHSNTSEEATDMADSVSDSGTANFQDNNAIIAASCPSVAAHLDESTQERTRESLVGGQLEASSRDREVDCEAKETSNGIGQVQSGDKNARMKEPKTKTTTDRGVQEQPNSLGVMIDAFHQDVQELPIPRRSATNSIPGAFAVVSFRPSGPLSAVDPNGRSLVLDDAPRSSNEQLPVQISEAHVVSDDEACGLENGSSSNHPGSISPFNDAEDTEVLEAKILPNNMQDEDQETKRIAGWLVAACFVAALILLLVFLLASGSQDDASTSVTSKETPPVPPDTAAPSILAAPVRYPIFHDDLPFEVSSAIEKDLDSSFYKANLWVQKDPHLASCAPARQKQRFYRAVVYYATNGEGWTHKDNWLSYEVPECDWFSQSSFSPDSKYYVKNVCDYTNETVTVINLSLASNNMTGSLPIWYTAFLPKLRVLDLGNNHIGGLLPIITSTPYVEVFVASNNDFQGAARLNAGAFFDSLKVMRTDGTQIRGNNRGFLIYTFKDLEVYNFTGQTFDGPIWPLYGLLTSLEYLGFGHTQTTGTIATELGLATSLKQLDMSSLPNVYGTIPSELGRLTDLTLLDISNTPITGTIPAPLCDRVRAGLLDIPANCTLLQCCGVSGFHI